MYGDVEPCAECGAAVRLRPHEPDRETGDGPVGPEDGVVGGADPTVDERVCTNDACPTNHRAPGEGAPRP
ncbi:hypothetical protein ACOACO_06145 [Nocardioides sp. CPCC 205120]|uniref:hypothetical protein n=1 Tax=Nocardioides sp. CPCC 205120 TaxID=3406462 RepID=UPI003B50C788